MKHYQLFLAAVLLLTGKGMADAQPYDFQNTILKAIQTVGEQKSGTGRYTAVKSGIRGWTEIDGRYLWLRFGVTVQLSAPVSICGVVYACVVQVAHQWFTTLLQFQLQFFKFFLGHETITVVVMCTIAGAKVQLNYNCYNV